jgi:transposase-like protein
MTAFRRVARTLPRSIRLGALITRHTEKKIRVLMLDAKHFTIRRKTFTLYVAFDAEAMMPVAWILLPRHEIRTGYDHLLAYLRRKKVAVTGIVSDGHLGLVASAHGYYPKAVHQHCAFHVLADTLRKLGGRKFLAPDEGRALWKKVRHVALECMTFKEARIVLSRLKFKYPNYMRAWQSLDHFLPGIYQFTKRPILAQYRTSNRMENFMGILEQRLKSCRSMKTPNQCVRIVSGLIAEKYKRPTKK